MIYRNGNFLSFHNRSSYLLSCFDHIVPFIFLKPIVRFPKQDVVHQGEKYKSNSIKKNQFPLSLCRPAQPWTTRPGSGRKDPWTDGDQRDYCRLCLWCCSAGPHCGSRNLHVIRSTRALSTPLWAKDGRAPTPTRGQTLSERPDPFRETLQSAACA